ncbi:putative transposase [Flavobacterium sp. CG_9.1]|jgi:putative transposase|uniref:transposase n=1 Tax=unclassified Flavobacterium TaxID=196869 RepID=UPI0018CA0F7B|nr:MULTISPECIES: transposase [unclassified Flavobacterium]MBG6063375.1 putative transposase [Flavobacterium sp. CG_9.1]MEC5165806.1 putative transposase [Flavobacterium sp. PL11]
MEKRKFTKEEKLKIIKEASEQGVKLTLEKYSVFPASYYAWKKKMDTMGEEGFSHGMTPDQLKRIRELEKENKLLKEIVIQKELEGKLKDELIKKKLALEKKKKL